MVTFEPSMRHVQRGTSRAPQISVTRSGLQIPGRDGRLWANIKQMKAFCHSYSDRRMRERTRGFGNAPLN